jgi:hypothetical protein
VIYKYHVSHSYHILFSKSNVGAVASTKNGLKSLDSHKFHNASTGVTLHKYDQSERLSLFRPVCDVNPESIKDSSPLNISII